MPGAPIINRPLQLWTTPRTLSKSGLELSILRISWSLVKYEYPGPRDLFYLNLICRFVVCAIRLGAWCWLGAQM